MPTGLLAAIRQRNPGRSLPDMAIYTFCHQFCELLLTLVYRYRVWGRNRFPATGPFLLVVNHQSHLDPIMAALASPWRHINFLARSTLFKNPAFGWLIRVLNSVPLKQGQADTAAIRTALEQLEAGRAVLIFPEGSRTPDGAMHPFKRGVWLLLKRANCPVIPVAVEGARDAWPRGQAFPHLFGKRLVAQVGRPIQPQTLLAMGEREGLEFLAATIESMRVELGAKLAREGYFVTSQPRSSVVVDP
jgi:1-acyl-sn-glycerol-3-phosphate acyltransferase